MVYWPRYHFTARGIGKRLAKCFALFTGGSCFRQLFVVCSRGSAEKVPFQMAHHLALGESSRRFFSQNFSNHRTGAHAVALSRTPIRRSGRRKCYRHFTGATNITADIKFQIAQLSKCYRYPHMRFLVILSR